MEQDTLHLMDNINQPSQWSQVDLTLVTQSSHLALILLSLCSHTTPTMSPHTRAKIITCDPHAVIIRTLDVKYTPNYTRITQLITPVINPSPHTVNTQYAVITQDIIHRTHCTQVQHNTQRAHCTLSKLNTQYTQYTLNKQTTQTS